MPPTDQLTPDPDAGQDAAEGFTLPSDLASSAGLTDLAPGDSFTVTISGTVKANDPATGISASLDSAMDGKKSDMPMVAGDEPGFVRPKGKIELGPEDWKK